MVFGIKNIRYAHVAGHTDVCYGSDSKAILTCGSDGNVRIFNGLEDEDPSADSVAEVTLAVACCKSQFFVATDCNYVQAFTFPGRKRDKIVFRFSAPVTHISVSANCTFIAAASCDMEIQVLNLETNKISVFTGHQGPVLGISLDPIDEFVVSSSGDGTVKVWDIASGALVKTFFDIVPVKNDFFKAISLGRTAWKSNSGSLLAIPKDFEVVVYRRNIWKIAFTLTSSNIEKALSAVLFSPCGNYVAAASTSGDVVIWEIKYQSEVCNFKDAKKVGISGFTWHPSGSEILFSDRLGRLGVLTGINEEISNHVVPNINKIIVEPTEDDILEQLSDVGDSNNLFDDKEDDENCISLEKIKASYHHECDDENPQSPSSVTSGSVVNMPAATLFSPQPPFQPSSTPSHFEPRCLCYNAIGIVRYYNSDKTVDVQFHDTLFHHALFLRSFGTCTMATLSSNVLCMAVPAVEQNLSKLTCVPLNPWDGSKEWTVILPEKENVIGLAAAANWVAVAIDTNQVRIFTHTGIQKQIVSLPGPVVCMSGFEQKLFVVCHLGVGINESQNEGFIIYQISNLSVRALNSFQPLPLFPKSVLNWMGFTDEGTLCTFDSEGILRLLAQDLLHWEVSCDTRNQRKSPSDHYFIVGLSEKYQNVRCVLCRNSYYPLMINNPTILEIPLKLPLCGLDSEKSIQEDTFWRLMFSLHSVVKTSNQNEYEEEKASFEQTLKQTALKLFAEACRNSEDMRALDVATFMSSQPLEAAIKYASKVGKTYLADKLNNLKPISWKDLFQDTDYLRENNELDRTTVGSINKNVYSQLDLFEDSVNTEKENINSDQILKSSECTSVSPEMPNFHGNNPFRKVTNKKISSPKGLQFFDTLVKKSFVVNQPPIQNKPLKLKVTSGSKEKSSYQTTEKPTFVQWFSIKKASLSEEYPNISVSELTKLGMKIYKETLANGKNEDKLSDAGDGNSQALPPIKRSLENDDNNDQNEIDFKKCKGFDEYL